MAVNIPAGLALLLVALLSASAAAHNITRILSNNPDFSSFNSLLSDTDLAPEINRRRTITVLAVSNDAIGAIAGFNLEIQRRILSVHVVLDYYDLDKLRNLKNRSTVLTTLFQTSGIANGRTGFLNVTKFGDDRVAFGSAAPGASLDADLEGSVAARPYTISVLQVSSIIFPPGIDGLGNNSPPPPPAVAKAPTPAKAKETPPSKAPAPAADAPTTKDTTPGPAVDGPADAPVADAPVGDAPVADGPTSAPEADSPQKASDEEAKSGAGRLAAGAGIGIMGAVLLAML